MGILSIPKVPKIASLQCLYNISKKKLEDEVDFLHADKHKSFIQVDFNTLGISLFTIFIVNNYYSITIRSKKLGMEFIFWMEINIKVSTS